MPWAAWGRLSLSGQALLLCVLLLLIAACGPRVGKTPSEENRSPTTHTNLPMTEPAPHAAAAGAAAEVRGSAPSVDVKIPAGDRGRILDQELKSSASIQSIDRMEDIFLIIDHDVPSKYAVDWYRIEFVSTDLAGRALHQVAQVFVPKAEDVSTFPLYVFGPGTTGLVDECAPSKEEPDERNWGDFQSHLLTYATQGYIAVMPDFEGFNDGDRIHHYYVGELQAHVLIDAARAALHLVDAAPSDPSLDQSLATPGSHPSNPVFFAGYSHGGYVALAARDYAQQYAPELNVKGAIGYGPRSAPATLFKEMPSLAPYLLYSYADFYGHEWVPFDRIFQPRWLRTLEHDVTAMCIDEVPTYYGADPNLVFTAEFLSALDTDTLDQNFPSLKALLDRNKTGLGGEGIPVLVLQGTEDTVVYPATLKAYMSELCATGSSGTYVSYFGIPHTLTRQVSYEDTLGWMATILQGVPPHSTCP